MSRDDDALWTLLETVVDQLLDVSVRSRALEELLAERGLLTRADVEVRIAAIRLAASDDRVGGAISQRIQRLRPIPSKGPHSRDR